MPWKLFTYWNISFAVAALLAKSVSLSLAQFHFEILALAIFILALIAILTKPKRAALPITSLRSRATQIPEALIVISAALLAATSHAPDPTEADQSAIVLHAGPKFVSRDQTRDLLVAHSDGSIYHARGRGSPGDQGNLQVMPSRGMFGHSLGIFISDVNERSPSVASAAESYLAGRLRGVSRGVQQLVIGLLIGKTGPDSLLRQDFKDTGLAHLLAISGLQISALGFVCLGIGRWVVRTAYAMGALSPPAQVAAERALTLLLCGGACGYAIICGLPQSINRALVIFVVYAIMTSCMPRCPLSQILSLALATQSLIFPENLLCEGTILSWGGFVILIANYSRPPGKSENPTNKWLTPILIQLQMSVLSAACFWRFQVIGIVMNLICVPCFFPVFFAAIALVVCGPDTVVGSVCIYVISSFVGLIHQVSVTTKVYPWLSLNLQNDVFSSTISVLYTVISIALISSSWRNLSKANEV